MKKCFKCTKDKELNEFYNNKNSKDGKTDACKSCCSNYSKKWYGNNIEKHNNHVIIYQNQNPEVKKKASKKWNKNNREYFKIYNKEQYKNNPNFRLRRILGNRLNEVLKKSKTYKSSNIITLLNCSLNELKQYLEEQFKPEMNWNNHGMVWEIDHIKSCDSFDLSQIEEQQKCFHYTNLQPLFKTTLIARSFGYLDEIGTRDKSNLPQNRNIY